MEGCNGAVKMARVRARAQVLTEIKFAIDRARKESLILANDDPELAAKFAILDDDFFGANRLDGIS